MFSLWLQEKELTGRTDAHRVATELTEVARRIAVDADIETGWRVLDPGSGTGAVAYAAADLGAGVAAIDVDAVAIERGATLARSAGAPVRHVVADARALPFEDATFHASVHRSILVYMRERERAVAEELRVLRPGARVSLSESLGSDLDLDTDDRGVARVWTGGLRDILVDTPDELTLSPSGLEELYRGEGFADVAISVEPRRVLLDSGDAVARAFVVSPPAGLSARERWLRAGIPGALLDEFLARLTAEAERSRPATLLAADAFLTARAPG